MDIKKVELLQPNKEQLDMGAVVSFNVITPDDVIIVVPADPTNVHYWEIKAWYDRRKKPPFDYKFEDLPEAKPEPESDEDGSGMTLASVQTEDAKLPEINLTKEQRKEISSQNK